MTNIQKMIITFLCVFFLTLAAPAFCIASTNNENLTLYCNNDLVMDANSLNVLFEKNGYEKVYPASTTKILTAILALENLDINESIVASSKAIYSTPVGSSIAYIKPGETMSLKNMLYCLLIVSGNDAANVIAEAVSGSNAAFVELMNMKLKEIGCNNTHFTNAHGFHDDNHYTTPYDMALLIHYAMQNDTFREIVETKELIIPPTNKSAQRKYTNTNKMFDEDYEQVYYEYILGGKTGYTDEARGAFVGYAKKDDKLLIVCTFDGSQNINGQEARFLDAKTLLEFSFSNFDEYKLIDKNSINFKITDKVNKKIYTIGLKDDIYAICKGSSIRCVYNTNIFDNLLNNQNLNSNIGTINLSLKGDSLDIAKEQDLILIEEADYIDISFIMKKCIKYIILLIILIILIRILQALKKRKKKKTRKKYN